MDIKIEDPLSAIIFKLIQLYQLLEYYLRFISPFESPLSNKLGALTMSFLCVMVQGSNCLGLSYAFSFIVLCVFDYQWLRFS